MLNRNSVNYAHWESTRLIGSPKFNNSRTLRRFLAEFIAKKLFCQCFAYDEGYSPAQLEALRSYAAKKALHQQPLAQQLGFELVNTLFDEGFELVQNVYKMSFELETASLQQLQAAVRMVQALAFEMLTFSRDPALEVGFQDYVYRGLPCTIAGDESLWLVSGCDKRSNGGGVLEWCFDEEDAKDILDKMKQFPDRFSDLAARPYLGWQKASSTAAQALANREPLAA